MNRFLMCNKFKSWARICVFAMVLAMPGVAAAINGTMYDCSRLASSLITRVCQDKYGFVWVATDFGLSKFDGYNFVNYYHDSNDTTTIVGNLITTFINTREGEFFIGCGKGLMHYDYESDHFVNYRFPDGIMPRVNSIVESQSGTLFVSTAGHGVFSLDKQRREVRPRKEFEALTDNRYLSIRHVEPSGHLWILTSDNRLMRLRLDGDKPADVQRIAVGGQLVDIEGEPGGSVLIATKHEILRFDPRTGKMTSANYVLPNNLTLSSLFIDRGGNIYIGFISRSLYIIRSGERVAQEKQIYNRQFLLPHLTINSIMEDKDGNIWLTSPRHGLFLCSSKKQKFHSWGITHGGERLTDGVSSIANSPGGGLYCTVNDKGLFHIDGNGRCVRVAAAPSDCSYIFRDSGGGYWLGTWAGLYKFNPATETCTLFDDLNGKGTLSIAEDREGRLYYTVFGEGFAIYDRRTRETRHYNTRRQPKNRGARFGNNWVGQMLCDSRGLMWISTASGMWCYDPVADRFLGSDNGDGILREVGINAISETSDGDIVVGSYSGLYLYRCKERKAMPLPGSEALKDMKIMALVKDGEGDIWISTVKGIWQYRSREERLVSHYGAGGIVEDEFCSGWFFNSSTDMVYFGTNSNVTFFNPKDISAAPSVGKVFLTRFATPSKVYSPLAHDYYLAWDDNSFTLQFSLLDYENASNVRYEYRINGGSWTAFPGDGNSLPFTKLKSGNYQIQVRAASGGEYSSEIKEIKVVVGNPWYATTTAKLVYFFLFLLMAFLVALYLHRRQKARSDEEKMQLLINATHDIRSPLTMILGPVEKLKQLARKTCDEQSAGSISQYADIIDRNAERLLLLVNQILDVRKIDKRQMRLKCRETDMVQFVERICRSYEFSAEERGIALSVRRVDNGVGNVEPLTAWIDRVNFDKVVTNLLSNAFKYTLDAGEITIDLGTDGKHLVMKVTDSGIGFGDEKSENLFRRFYQGRNSAENAVVGTGIGLNLTKKIVELHGGTIVAANRTDGHRGACITVSLPLGNSHLKPEDMFHDDKSAEIDKKKIIFHKGTILVVDDDSELSAYVAAELNQWYRVDVYSNGVDALQALLTGSYDLVVSDVMMPGMDGIALLRKIKHNPNISHIPVIMLSSKSEIADRLAGFKSGADAYLAKPFSIDELHARIDAMIDNVRRMRGKFTGAQQQRDRIEDIEVRGYDDNIMERVMKSVNAHIGDCDFNVDTLALEVGLSRAQLHRKIKEFTGVSTAKFVRNLRMEQAERLLREGKVNITQVAYSVGFSDQTYFSTVFKQYYGVKPSEYAKK